MASADGEEISKREKARLAVRDFVYSYIPITYWLPRYKFKEYFTNDLLAGLTIGCLHISQGMAFAMLAHVKPILGLYTACLPVFIYCVFGTAVYSSFGPVSVTSILVGETVLNVRDESVDYSAEKLVQVITFLVGVIYLVTFLIRYHVVTKLLSKYMTSPFLIACALQIIMKALKLLFGLKVTDHVGYFSFIYNSYNTFKVIKETNLITLGMSVSILILFAVNTYVIIPQMKKVTRIVFPMELIVLIIITTLSYTLEFQRFSIHMLGHVPTGPPTASLPEYYAATYVWKETIELGIINFASTFVYIIMLNPDARLHQELLALALCNLICCHFNTIPIGNSMMRTMVAVSSGKITLLTDIISSVLVLMAVLFMGPLFSPLPLCFLGCIVVWGLLVLIINECRKIPGMFSNGWENAVIWVITGVVTLFISIELGLLIGLVLTLRQYLTNSTYEEPYKKDEDRVSQNNQNPTPTRK